MLLYALPRLIGRIRVPVGSPLLGRRVNAHLPAFTTIAVVDRGLPDIVRRFAGVNVALGIERITKPAHDGSPYEVDKALNEITILRAGSGAPVGPEAFPGAYPMHPD